MNKRMTGAKRVYRCKHAQLGNNYTNIFIFNASQDLCDPSSKESNIQFSTRKM